MEELLGAASLSSDTVQKQETPSEKPARCSDSPTRGRCLHFIYVCVSGSLLTSKQRDVNEGSRVQREAYVNVTSPDVPRLSEPRLQLAPGHVLAVSI